MAPLKKKKGPPEMTYGSQIYHGSPKVLRGTQGAVLVLCYPRQKGLEPRCGGPPPPPYTSTTSSILLQVIDCEADALPLLWEINSGGGVNCGDSMYHDWKQFQFIYAHFIGS